MTRRRLYPVAIADMGVRSAPMTILRKRIFCNRTVAHIFATKQLHVMPAEARRDVFQALADPTRRAILTLLAAGALTPNALADHFHTSRQAVSKHIKILTECGLVVQEASGREIYYYCNARKIKEVDKWLAPFRTLWEGRFNELDAVLKNLKNKKS